MEDDDERLEAIPTLQDGVAYKSRLEARFARWAAYNSDPSRTRIIHEPHRIGRNRYLPDFLIVALGQDDEVYIEIKPIKYADEAWIAIEAARETGACLMVIDQFARDRWGCFASVSYGDVDYFSTLPQHVLRVSIPIDRCRPIYHFNGSASALG